MKNLKINFCTFILFTKLIILFYNLFFVNSATNVNKDVKADCKKEAPKHSSSDLKKLIKIERKVVKKYMNDINKGEIDLSINDIKKKINEIINKKKITYEEYRINSMANRIFQRLEDIYIYNESCHDVDSIYKLENYITEKFMKLLQSNRCTKNVDTKNFFEVLRHRILIDDNASKLLSKNLITKMTWRVIQRASDIIFRDSSSYSDLVIVDDTSEDEEHTYDQHKKQDNFNKEKKKNFTEIGTVSQTKD
ncbi:hypothetical protein HEP_00070200 [Hepatocystis sp. ex Piliocolobus tephrosceles]|nr:hypothetical protein HEP_00070200 [Hepatocystis sp. ex Piliocolobus tephrosceles]